MTTNQYPRTNTHATAAGGNPALVAAIRGEIAASGPITFARFMDRALYDPDHGYYRAEARRPGRGGDFITAPEIHPFFGFTLARFVEACWERLGRPRSFVVREYGPGIGGLAYDIIAAISEKAPELRAALDYRLVERNPHRRAQALVALAERGLGDVVRAEEAGMDPLPPIVGVALANEVADALPVHRLVWRDGELRERWVTWDEAAGRFADAEGARSPAVAALDVPAYLAAHGVTLAENDAIEVSPAAAAWFATVARGLAQGYTLLLDYGYPAATLYRDHRLAGTVRGYAGHTVTDDPYQRVGEQDLTAHVDFTRLQAAGEAAGLTFAGLTTQADFLADLGLGDLLVGLQTEPGTSVADYYAAQAAVLRLIDPGGMGRFRVLAMARSAPTSPPLPGFAEGRAPSAEGRDEGRGRHTASSGVNTSATADHEATARPSALGPRPFVFLCGADMDPTAVRARFPDARFVDVAHCAGPLPGLTAMDDLADGGVWGILVRASAAGMGDEAVEIAVTLPDGEQALARLATRPADVADAGAVAAAVRYWELPPAYRMRAITRAE